MLDTSRDLANYRTSLLQRTIQMLLFLVVTQSTMSLCAADFWNAKFLTSDKMRNRLESPPAYDTSGSVVAVWERDTPGTVPEIYMARSADSGIRWNTQAVRSVAAPAGVAERSPIVVTDKNGAWLCVWSSNDPRSGTTPADYDILYSQSSDAGATWSSPQLLNSTGSVDNGNDTSPSVSMDLAGNCIAAWTSDNDTTDVSGTTSSLTNIWMSRSSDGGQTWTPAEPMAQGPGESLSAPCLATNGEARFGFVWVSIIGQDNHAAVKFSYSTNAGTTWTQASIMNSETGSEIPASKALNPALAGDSSGRWMAAWTALKDPDWPVPQDFICVARTPDNGATWLSVQQPFESFQSGLKNKATLYTNDSGAWVLGAHESKGSSRLAISANFGSAWSILASFPTTAPPLYPGFPEPPEDSPYAWCQNETDWNVLFGKVPTSVDPVFPDGKFEIRQATPIFPSVPPASPDWSLAKSFYSDGTPLYGAAPQLSIDGTNTWIVVYVLVQPGITGDTEIGFTSSSNGGTSWSTPQVLNNDWQNDTATEGHPVIAASEGSEWLCAWMRSDGKIWLARSFDSGQTWSDPQPVMLPGDISVTGVSPGISSLGKSRWLLVWQEDDKIYSSKTLDNGYTWGAPVFVQGRHTVGYCGNTTPCWNDEVYSPNVFSTPGNRTVFVGFDRYTANSPNGYIGPINYYGSTDGHISRDGGESYDGNLNYRWPAGPKYIGSNEMATDGSNKWISARNFHYDSQNFSNFSFGQSFDNGETFTYTAGEIVDGRANLWGKVALDQSGHWFRLGAIGQFKGFGVYANYIILSSSVDYGSSWTPYTQLDTQTPYEASAPVSMSVKGGHYGEFIAVWQANLPTGEQTIWYSINNKYYDTSAVKNWQLFDN